MSNQIQNPNNKDKYDLIERTGNFGEEIIEFVQKLPKNFINNFLSAPCCACSYNASHV